MNLIVGLAGHIDHGKTSLIKAINGFDGDSLAQERERGITIDISFSNLKIRDKNIAFIDVPGHEKLVKNMISGAFGFDIVLLCVSSDDGLMPQSFEHLKICSILGIKRVLVAITKSDLVSKERLDSLKDEIREELIDFEIVEICPVSTKDRESIERIKEILYLVDAKVKSNCNFSRIYIDRVFNKKGFGSIITGTILSGTISKGQKLLLADLKREAFVKSIQVHGEDVQSATEQNRVAINLSNIKNLEKGMLLTEKGYLRGFDLIDCYVRAFEPIYHGSSLNFHIGSRDIEAKVFIYDGDVIESEGFIRLKLAKPVFAIFKEPFILRGDRSVGGGAVLSPISDPLKKRDKLKLLEELKRDNFKEAFEILSNAHKKGFGLISSYQRFNLTHQEAIDIAKGLDCILDEKALVIYPNEIVDTLSSKIEQIYIKNSNALLSINSVNQNFSWSSLEIVKLAFDKLEKEKLVVKKKNLFLSNQNSIVDIDEFLKDKIFKILEDSNYTPDAPYNIYDSLNIDKKLGDTVLKSLTKSKKVIRLAHNLFITSSNLTKIITLIKEIIKKDGYIEIKNFKENLNISRKYLVAYLDYIDNLDYISKEKNRRFMKYVGLTI